MMNLREISRARAKALRAEMLIEGVKVIAAAAGDYSVVRLSTRAGALIADITRQLTALENQSRRRGRP
jgi:hypothetical protein